MDSSITRCSMLIFGVLLVSIENLFVRAAQSDHTGQNRGGAWAEHGGRYACRQVYATTPPGGWQAGRIGKYVTYFFALITRAGVSGFGAIVCTERSVSDRLRIPLTPQP